MAAVQPYRHGGGPAVPAWRRGSRRASRSRKPDSANIGTISITAGVRRTGWNAMKPWIQCVLAQ